MGSFTLSVNEECRALRGPKWQPARVISLDSKQATVVFKDGVTQTNMLCEVQKMKKAKTYKKTVGERYNPIKARMRYRRWVTVQTTRFSPMLTMGNFGKMLSDPDIRRHGVCVFNDNLSAWAKHVLSPGKELPAGGGNAVARKWQHEGHSIGMPTGPFANLDEQHSVFLTQKEFHDSRKEFISAILAQLPDAENISVDPPPPFHTAREIIDEAAKRIVRLFLDNDWKEVMYYSIDPDSPPGSTQIGLAIFAGAVGADVVNYISTKLQEIPYEIRKARDLGMCP